MADLRELMTDAGYGDVRTYLQSGNVVLLDAALGEAHRRGLRAPDRGAPGPANRRRRANGG